MGNERPGCAKCPFERKERVCQDPAGKSPSFCPTVNRPNIIEKVLDELKKPEIFEFARQASIQGSEGWMDRDLGSSKAKPLKPRIVETIEFAMKMKYKKLGLVFCMGLRKEAKIVEGLLAANGFDVISVVCKIGRIPQKAIGRPRKEGKEYDRPDAMCNPIAQAFLLNEEKTEFNIMMGLCIGHDSLFLKYAEAPCTVFAVKDRVLCHNPLAAIYNIDGYYKSIKTIGNP